MPVVGDPQVATGRFNIVCSGDGEGDEELEEVEAIGEPVHVGAPEAPIERPRVPSRGGGMHREWEFYLLALEAFEADLRDGWEPPEDQLELFWFDYVGRRRRLDSEESGEETLNRIQASWPELISAPRPLEGPESLYLLSLVFCHGTRLDEDPDCRHYEFGDESDLELTSGAEGNAGLWERLTSREVAGLTPGVAGPGVAGEPGFGWLGRDELELAHRLPDVEGATS